MIPHKTLLVGAAGLLLGLLYLVMHKGSKSGTSTPTADTTGTAEAYSSGGMIYVPTSETIYNFNSNNTTTTTGPAPAPTQSQPTPVHLPTPAPVPPSNYHPPIPGPTHPVTPPQLSQYDQTVNSKGGQWLTVNGKPQWVAGHYANGNTFIADNQSAANLYNDFEKSHGWGGVSYVK